HPLAKCLGFVSLHTILRRLTGQSIAAGVTIARTARGSPGGPQAPGAGFIMAQAHTLSTAQLVPFLRRATVGEGSLHVRLRCGPPPPASRVGTRHCERPRPWLRSARRSPCRPARAARARRRSARKTRGPPPPAPAAGTRGTRSGPATPPAPA